MLSLIDGCHAAHAHATEDTIFLANHRTFVPYTAVAERGTVFRANCCARRVGCLAGWTVSHDGAKKQSRAVSAV
jgi:hypothetical protein